MCGTYRCILCTSNLDLVSYLLALYSTFIYLLLYRSFILSFFNGTCNSYFTVVGASIFFLNRTCDSYCTYTTFGGKTITIDMCVEENMNPLLDEQSSGIVVELHLVCQ